LGALNTEDSLGVLNQHLRDRWSGGGAWFCTKTNHTFVPPVVGGEPETLIQGPVRMGSNTTSIVDLPMNVPSDSQLNALGTTAIARTEPTNPAFDLSVTLGELWHEGIPNAPGAQVMETTKAAKLAGGGYLNIEFGWLPLVRSIRDFAKVVDKHDKIIDQYQQGANRTIKRSYQWDPVTDNKYTTSNFGAVPVNGSFTGGGRYQSVEQRKWFEVDYVYHLPTGGAVHDKVARYGSYARKLLGVRLTPEVVWNLAPWSWAADWVANTGDVIHNISAIGTDGLVIRNGYIMCHTRRVKIDSGRYNGKGVTCFHTVVDESKIRIPATPYGFGLTYGSLTTKQKAILVALGLSKW